MGILSWFRKNKQVKQLDCTSCYYYAELKSSDRVNPDKTVTKGQILFRQCKQGKFSLLDLVPCPLYQKRKHGEFASTFTTP